MNAEQAGLVVALLAVMCLLTVVVIVRLGEIRDELSERSKEAR